MSKFNCFSEARALLGDAPYGKIAHSEKLNKNFEDA